MPPAHERVPLHVISHWSPEHFTSEPQLSCPSHRMVVLAAVLVMAPAQSPADPQVTWHLLPAQSRPPAHDLPCSHVMSQLLPCEQSTPPAHPEAPQVTSQACWDGQVTAFSQAPCPEQSNAHVP